MERVLLKMKKVGFMIKLLVFLSFLVLWMRQAVAVVDGSSSAATIRKSVFDDVGMWIKGAYDRDDAVGMDQDDLRHAFSASSKFSNLLEWGAATNCVRRYEHVVCPYAGIVMSNVPCIYMPRNIDAEGARRTDTIRRESRRIRDCPRTRDTQGQPCGHCTAEHAR